MLDIFLADKPNRRHMRRPDHRRYYSKTLPTTCAMPRHTHPTPRGGGDGRVKHLGSGGGGTGYWGLGVLRQYSTQHSSQLEASDTVETYAGAPQRTPSKGRRQPLAGTGVARGRCRRQRVADKIRLSAHFSNIRLSAH